MADIGNYDTRKSQITLSGRLRFVNYTMSTIVVIFLINIRLGRVESEKEKELSNLRLQNLRGSLRLGELERSQVSQNIAKGTTDPRVECVCLSSSAKHKNTSCEQTISICRNKKRRIRETQFRGKTSVLWQLFSFTLCLIGQRHAE